MTNAQRIVSWLKYLDVEYIEEDLCKALAELDINNPADHEQIIHLAMDEEVNQLNEISRESMKKILGEVDGYPEIEVRQVIERVGMPFHEPLIEYRKFFRSVNEHFF
jgi:hypothetical protein